MVRIAISRAAYEGIVATLTENSRLRWLEADPQGRIYIWLDRKAMEQLEAVRLPSEGYSETILRLSALENA